MKKRKLIPTTILASLLALGGLVACGDEENANGGNDVVNPDNGGKKEKITITSAGNKKALIKGETLQLSANVEGVKWTSSKPDIASVDDNGLVTALKKGSAAIKAEKDGYDAGTFNVSVNYENIAVTAAGNKTELLIDEEVQLSADKTGVTWSSSNAEIATVDANGKVKAVKLGEVTIYAKKDDHNDGTITIKVVRPEPTAVLPLEEAEHESADGWYSSNSNGTERGPGASPVYEKDNASNGTCVAYLGVGDKETLKFTSSAAVKAEVIFFIGYYYSIEDITTVLKVKFNNVEIDLTGQSYTSEDTTNYLYHEITLGEVDLINGENVLEIEIKEGATNIPYFDDVKVYANAATTITAKPAPALIDITVSNDTVAVDEGATATIVPGVADCKFSVADSAIATVDANGVVTGVKAGSTKVTVFKKGYKSIRVSVNVSEKLLPGSYKLEAEEATRSSDAITFRTPSASSQASGYTTNEWPLNETLTFSFNADEAMERELTLVGRASGSGYSYTDVDLATDIDVTVNGVKLTISGTISGSTISPYSLGMINVAAGANTIVIKNNNLAPTVDYLKIAPKAEAPAQEVVKEWSALSTDANLTKNADVGADYIRVDTAKILPSLKDGTINMDQSYAADLVNPAEGSQLGYKVNLDAAVTKAELWMEATGNSSATWFGRASNDNSRTLVLNDAGTEYVPAQYRYAIKINGVEVPFVSDGGTSSNSKVWVKFAIGDFALNAGDNTIEIIGLGGYRAKIANFKLVKVA